MVVLCAAIPISVVDLSSSFRVPIVLLIASLTNVFLIDYWWTVSFRQSCVCAIFLPFLNNQFSLALQEV